MIFSARRCDSAGLDITYTWSDPLTPAPIQKSGDTELEEAALLFNLAALASKQSADCDRTTIEGLSEATSYQRDVCAFLAYLGEHVSPRLSPEFRTHDIGQVNVLFLEKMSLGQAQQLCFESACLSGKSASILAKLAKKSAELFGEAVSVLDVAAAAPTVPGQPKQFYPDKSWRTHAHAKTKLFAAYSEFYQAKVHNADDDNGLEVTRLREAAELLTEMQGIVKGTLTGSRLHAVMRKLQDDVQLALRKAEKDNVNVYMCRIPPYDTIPVIAGVLIVKPSAIDDLVAIGEEADDLRGLFRTIVPEVTTRTISKFTDMADQLVRKLVDSMEAVSETAQVSLRLWELPECLACVDRIPETLIPENTRTALEKVSQFSKWSSYTARDIARPVLTAPQSTSIPS